MNSGPGAGMYYVYSVIALAILTFSNFNAAAITVQLETGSLRGETLDGINIFRGIPFAAAPTGDLRWRNPQSHPGWEGVRDATKFGKICPQNDGLVALTGGSLPETSEDCLFLNIWSPNGIQAKPLPVMFWIHGGGLSLGWSNQELYRGHEFAKRNVVLVTVNYRLGPLGFLAHPELAKESSHGASGNYGFHDQLAALQWVQNNISLFGGDPSNVTIFGESAGGTSVFALVASPLSQGLFHRAIAQSPWISDTNIAQQNEPNAFVKSSHAQGLEWASNIKPNAIKGIDGLRKLSADKIISSESNFQPGINIEGWFMSEDPETLFAEGQQLDIPMIIGTNRDEGTLFMGQNNYREKGALETMVRATYGDKTGKVVELYLKSGSPNVREAVNQFMTDSMFLNGARNMLYGTEKISSKYYQYFFSRSNQLIPMLGANHALELGYVFNTTALAPKSPAGPTDRAIADSMIRHWVQFAKNGNPNSDELLTWPAYDTSSQQYKEFGDEIRIDSVLNKERLDSFQKIRQSLLAL